MSSGIFTRYSRVGATFNDFLDSIDGSYCAFEGGDDPTQDGVYPDTQLGGYTGMFVCLSSENRPFWSHGQKGLRRMEL